MNRKTTLPTFRPGMKKIKASDLNAIVAEVERLRNIQADKQSDIVVTVTKNGLLIGRRRAVLLIDDKYLLDSAANQSDRVRRKCDLKEGDIADLIRIRAVPGGSERKQGISRYLPGYKVMLFVNPIDEQGGEGGWVTDAGKGFDHTEKKDSLAIAPPIRRVAQWGTLIQLTDDDVSVQTEDGDGFTIVNVRDDAHFHKDEEHDGRVFFTLTPPGDVPTGYPICGEMVNDPRLQDFDTRLGRESGEWRPQLVIPNLDIPGEIYTPWDTAQFSFPPVMRIPGSSIMAYDFGKIGKEEAWSAHYQPQHWLESYGLGFLIKYSAENTTGSPQNAYFDMLWKVANNGGDISTAGFNTAAFTLPVPAGSATTTLRHAYVGFVNPLQYIDKSLVVLRRFARRATNILDTLTGSCYVIEVKMIFMVVVVPP